MLTNLSLIELSIEILLIIWIMIATINGLRKVAPLKGIKHLDLMKGIWKLEAALGLALAGLAGLGVVVTALYPYSFGILILLVTLGVFILTHLATRELSMVPIIAKYTEKMEAWAKTQK